jgi:hypothetical protein
MQAAVSSAVSASTWPGDWGVRRPAEGPQRRLDLRLVLGLFATLDEDRA